jgi:hypothetical protein
VIDKRSRSRQREARPAHKRAPEQAPAPSTLGCAVGLGIPWRVARLQSPLPLPQARKRSTRSPQVQKQGTKNSTRETTFASRRGLVRAIDMQPGALTAVSDRELEGSSRSRLRRIASRRKQTQVFRPPSRRREAGGPTRIEGGHGNRLVRPWTPQTKPPVRPSEGGVVIPRRN